MKSVITIIGVLSMLVFSNEGILKTHIYSSQRISNGLLYFESSPSEAHWEFEELQTRIYGLSEELTSFKKRRIIEANDRISNNVKGICRTFTQRLLKAESKINLFIVYHFSLSLWQVFLQ